MKYSLMHSAIGRNYIQELNYPMNYYHAMLGYASPSVHGQCIVTQSAVDRHQGHHQANPLTCFLMGDQLQNAFSQLLVAYPQLL